MVLGGGARVGIVGVTVFFVVGIFAVEGVCAVREGSEGKRMRRKG
jgi:hypothetical protein